ncbi:hypothetical protein EDB87DRAFT_1610367 [Lactarius vividus]|nr:hypothetical protein EDB87DRAFT_1610367 [Lactarius vividus]
MVPGGQIGIGTQIDPTPCRALPRIFTSVRVPPTSELPTSIGSTSIGWHVLSIQADLAKIQLISPAWTEVGEKVTSIHFPSFPPSRAVCASWESYSA